MIAPIATYRLQIQPAFPLSAARAWADYGRALGISHLYASPLLEALPGSTHGYDVCDPSRVNPELGGESGFSELIAKLREQGLGLVLDIVPNHMAADPRNPYWRNLLELGSASPYAAWFDVDWAVGTSRPPAHAVSAAKSKLILPLLGETTAQALQRGLLSVRFVEGEFQIVYYQQSYPFGLSALPYFLRTPAPPPIPSLTGQLRRLALSLHQAASWDASRAHELRLEFADFKSRLARFSLEAPLSDWLAAHLRWWNQPYRRTNADATLRRAWPRLLASQPWRLVAWRGAGRQVNYRRFFALNHLVGVRQELPAVFEATHARVFDWLAKGEISGLRIDHVDGLFDPAAYLNRLQRARPANAPRSYLIVEKILARQETLPADWPVAGTTGYDSLNLLNQLFLEPAGMARLTEIYTHFLHRRRPRGFDEIARARQREIVESHFSGELKRLVHELRHAAGQRGLQLDEHGLERALRELTVALPAYRSYRNSFFPSERDRSLWEEAWNTASAQWRRDSLPESVLAFLHQWLLPGPSEAVENPAEAEAARRAELLCLEQWQQWSGAVKAKGIEDTAFYTYNRLLAQNEVGGWPDIDGLSVAEFHRLVGERQRMWPLSWNAATTHDTKRSEDGRIRLNLLSEMAEEWGRRVRGWHRLARRLKPRSGHTLLPGPNLEYYLYQTLVAAWPADAGITDEFRERIAAHMLKAARELKGRTRWSHPNPAFEQALAKFIAHLLTNGAGAAFRADFTEFLARLAPLAAAESLAQLALRLALPGTPDIYQGTELWDLRLVDPDNRAPVDFALRRRLLTEVRAGAESNLAAALEVWRQDWSSGKIKLYLLWRGLHFRREHPELFLEGEYLPLDCEPAAPATCAFARRFDRQWLIAAAPVRMLPRGQSGLWQLDSRQAGLRMRLPADTPAAWRHLLTGERLTAQRDDRSAYLNGAQLWKQLPAAWLVPA